MNDLLPINKQADVTIWQSFKHITNFYLKFGINRTFLTLTQNPPINFPLNTNFKELLAYTYIHIFPILPYIYIHIFPILPYIHIFPIPTRISYRWLSAERLEKVYGKFFDRGAK